MASPTVTNHHKPENSLLDPIWRLHNLYYVKNAKGKIVKFVPSPEQDDIINAIYTEGLRKIVILKARQLGMSTVIDIILLDQAVFNKGVQAAIVDLTQGDASKKLENKIRFAYNRLPQDIRESFKIKKDSGKQFQLEYIDRPEDGHSEIQAGMNARGDTFQILHISEWGAIQHEDEQRSVEIVTGALPAAKEGIVIVETTWKGGKGGPLWEIVHNSMTTSEEDRTDQDFTLFFFPWYTDASYHVYGKMSQIDDETNAYLDDLEKQIGCPLEPSQRLWYYKVAMQKGFYRFREYPSTLEECFKGKIDGAIYQTQMLKAHSEGRVTEFPYAEDHLVHTFWDLGSPLNTATWFVQFVGREIHLVDLIAEEDLTLAERLNKIFSLPYLYGNHFLPHDALAQERAGRNFVDQAKEIGLQNIVVLPKPHSIWPGINHVLQIMNRFHFRIPQTQRGVEAMEAYRTKRDKTNDYQTEIPVHDWTSHICDPLRIMAEADMASMFNSSLQNVSTQPKKRRRRRSLARI